MGVNSLPETVTRQCRGCNLNPGPSAPESSTLTTRLPSHPGVNSKCTCLHDTSASNALYKSTYSLTVPSKNGPKYKPKYKLLYFN